MPTVGAGSGIIRTASVALTDAQIKALPTAGVQAIAAPGANAVIVVLGSVWRLDATHGAYANFSNFRIGLFYGATANIASSPYIESAQGAFADASAVHLIGVDEVYSGGVTWFADLTQAANEPCVLSATNGVAGNLTGGNAANTMQVTTSYWVIGV